MERWVSKANAYATGWLKQFGVFPSLANVIVGLSIAQHVTHCGDTWPGEYNWGACLKRSLDANERSVLLKIPADPTHVALARATFNEAIHRGWLPASDWDDCGLHVASAPVGDHLTWFWVMRWRFKSEAEGASHFVYTLAGQRPGCKVLLESPEMDQHSGEVNPINYCLRARLIVAQMYATHYFTGEYDPHQPGGAQANVDTFASAVCVHTATVASVLRAEGWTPDLIRAGSGPASEERPSASA